MEQKDIDIYEILKGMPEGTPLYSPMCGNVYFTSVAADKEKTEAIWTEDKNEKYSFDKNGKWMEEGEVLLFPSNEMRDWSKFFKKGDVLVFKGIARQGICIFEKYEDDTLVRFRGRYASKNGDLHTLQATSFETEDWVNRGDPASYIKLVEERLGGELNLENLEIEKPAKLTFEVGRLYVFNEDDEDGELTIIGKLIDKNESEDTLTFGNQYEIENQKFVTDQALDLRISTHKELREATEDEVLMFQEARTLWKKEKEAKEQPAFKPFDKVLVRCGKKCKWLPAFFVRDRGDEFAWRYNVLPIHSGKSADFINCIPFEGNENIAFTNYDFEDLPF